MLASDDAARSGPAGPAVTHEQLVHDFVELGVGARQTLLVHSSLRSVGWVDGGAGAVARALLEVLGPDGNLVVPASTETNSMTSHKHRERIADMTSEQVKQYRDEMPPFDQDTTESGAGAIAEAVRKRAGAVRSGHPQSSFAAIGPEADYLMADHQLECHLGEESPLGKLYKKRARVLMIGVGYRSCTAFHLAEYRYRPDPPEQTYACVITEAGERKWKSYHDVVLDDREFEEIGKALEAELVLEPRYVGKAECRLLSLPYAVDFAVDWMGRHRS
jgi:aminoglycoside 3-N-acetyltransferase